MATRFNAIHGVNRYLWDKGLNPRNPLFYENTGEIPSAAQPAVWNSVYGGRMIFAPVNQIDRFKNEFKRNDGSSNPYVVFNYTTPASNGDWFVESEQAIYLLYSNDLEEIRTMVNFIHDEMKKFDESAQNVNAYLDKLNDARYANFEYKSIAVANISGATPTGEAGGLMEAMITLDITYTQLGR